MSFSASSYYYCSAVSLAKRVGAAAAMNSCNDLIRRCVVTNSRLVLTQRSALVSRPPRRPSRCQRKKGTLGKGLGKTTGWIHRTSLKKHGQCTSFGSDSVPIRFRIGCDSVDTPHIAQNTRSVLKKRGRYMSHDIYHVMVAAPTELRLMFRCDSI